MLPDQVDARISLLEEFLELLTRYANAMAGVRRAEAMFDQRAEASASSEAASLRSRINRKTAAADAAAEQSGVVTTLVVGAPPVVGGQVTRVDLFSNIFGELYLEPMLPHVIQCVEKAIGAYEAIKLDPSLGPHDAAASLDLVNAIRRALRPTFRTGPPNNEREVQDAVEVILQAIGADYTRDKEVAAVGPTTFKPDFIMPGEDLAIEVKLANVKHDAAKVQHELTEDVAGYRTRWKRLMAIVYDCGVIHDPEQMREANEQHFGVTVLIVKH